MEFLFGTKSYENSRYWACAIHFVTSQRNFLRSIKTPCDGISLNKPCIMQQMQHKSIVWSVDRTSALLRSISVPRGDRRHLTGNGTKFLSQRGWCLHTRQILVLPDAFQFSFHIPRLFFDYKDITSPTLLLSVAVQRLTTIAFAIQNVPPSNHDSQAASPKSVFCCYICPSMKILEWYGTVTNSLTTSFRIHVTSSHSRYFITFMLLHHIHVTSSHSRYFTFMSLHHIRFTSSHS